MKKELTADEPFDLTSTSSVYQLRATRRSTQIREEKKSRVEPRNTRKNTKRYFPPFVCFRAFRGFSSFDPDIEMDDFELTPFNAKGGAHKAYQVFGEEFEKIIDELNSRLAA